MSYAKLSIPCYCIALLIASIFPSGAIADEQANRLTHLDSDSPYYVSGSFPKLTTPMWIGEKDVEAVVLLSVDDLGLLSIDHFEQNARPTLERLKEIDGRAPVTFFVNRVDPDTGHLQRWLKEGVGLEVHTFDHPCPLLTGGNFAGAKSTVDRCIDLLNEIPNVKPTTIRVPCCDILNTNSPQFISEILNKKTESGNFLAMDSSVHHLFTRSDKTLPRDLVMDEADRDRFRKFTIGGAPFLGRPVYTYVNYVENYPYPYVIDRLCWEVPIQIPGDHQAAQYENSYGKRKLKDWKAALDATTIKQGIMTLCYHFYGKTESEEIIELIDYATEKHGPKVKFLNFADVESRISKNLLAGQRIRAADGSDNGIRLLDLNNDGYLDVVIANEVKQLTRVWDPVENSWKDGPTPFQIRSVDSGKSRLAAVQFGIVGPVDQPIAMQFQEGRIRAWRFAEGEWQDAAELVRGLEGIKPDGFTRPASGDIGLRLRDIDSDGRCELLLSNPQRQVILKWSVDDGQWKTNAFQFPQGAIIVDEEGRDAGLRFVDLNDDGSDDLIFSDKSDYAVYQFVSAAKGWSKTILAGRQDSNTPLPPIVIDGAGRGAFFHSGRLWYINELTSELADHALSIKLNDLAELKSPNWITQWMALGPFPNQNEKGLDRDFGIESDLVAPDLKAVHIGIDDKKTTWQPVQATVVGGGLGFDLQRFCQQGGHRTNDLVVYLASWIDSSKPQTGELRLGSEDGVKVWLNGKLVHHHAVRRQASPGQDRVKLDLKQGKNTLVIKLEQVSAGGALMGSLHAPEQFTVFANAEGRNVPQPAQESP